MDSQLKILLLEDSMVDAELIKRLLMNENSRIDFRIETEKAGFLKALEVFSPDVVLSDHSMPRFNSGEALKLTRQWMIHVPFILVTGTVSEDFAAEMIKLGADDYILKDRMARLSGAIEGALERRKALKEISAYKIALDQFAIVAITDQKGNILHANKKFCEISQYTVTELVGQNHRIINSGYHPTAFFEDMWSTIAKGNIWKGQILNKAKDKSFYWVDTSIIPFVNAKGKPYEYLAIRMDITEKKRIEQELITANERFELVVNATNDVIWDWNLESNRIWWNKNYYSYFGYEQNSAPIDVSSWHSNIHPEDKERVVSGLSDSIRSGKHTWTDEYQVICADGRVAFVLDCGYIVYNKDEKPYRIVGAMLDITHRKQMEKELRKSRDLFERATEATSDLIWELDIQTGKYYLHHQKMQVFDDKMVLKWQPGTGGEYIVEEERKRVITSFYSAMASPTTEIWEMSYSVHARNKEVMYIVNHAIFMRSENGIASKCIGALTDETEKRKLEFEVQEQQKREQLTITSTALAAQEKERNTIGLELHDNVNQILAAAKLVLSFAMDDPCSSAEYIYSALDNVQNAINETRRIAHELVAPDFKEIDLASMIEILSVAMIKQGGMDVDIDADCLSEDLLNSDLKLSVYRIAQEQFTNIVKHSQAQLVNIVLATGDGYLRMIIGDDGIGIAKGETPRGIGLRNIRGRVTTLNGEVKVISAHGLGFTLEIKIPL